MQERGGDFTFRGSWRATYLAASGLCTTLQQDRRKLLQVQGLFSDLLYQPHFCATTPLRPEWLERDILQRRAGLSAEDFHRLYELPNRPVVLTDAVRLATLLFSSVECMHACGHCMRNVSCTAFMPARRSCALPSINEQADRS